MISRKEVKNLPQGEPRLENTLSGLYLGSKIPRKAIKEIDKVVAVARKFNREVIRPGSLELDLRMHQDPDYLPRDFVKKANEWGFYTYFIPRVFGGKGYSIVAVSSFLEELASGCLGMANLVGVHYLGVISLAATMNIGLMARIFRETAMGEKTGEPVILSTAITEPGAGTDVEEVDLVDRGNVICHARRVKGGYIVNGTKVFISSGHLSTWHMLIAYTDTKKPSENTILLAVRNGAKGFSFGRMERKMGQKACCASELIFQDCFVPDENVGISMEDYHKYKTGLTPREITGFLLDDVLAGSRAGVGAFGVGAARGAYEEALKFALETEVEGRLLINHEWAQCILTDMYANAATARLSYLESTFVNALYGPMKDFFKKPFYYYMKYAPSSYLKFFVYPFMKTKLMTYLARKRRLRNYLSSDTRRTAGWGSMAKYTCTDAGIKNCHLALELMGQAGVRHDRRAEKFLRDAKLLQIYEGTNQLNRLNVFKCMIAPDYRQVKPFGGEVL